MFGFRKKKNEIAVRDQMIRDLRKMVEDRNQIIEDYNRRLGLLVEQLRGSSGNKEDHKNVTQTTVNDK